MEVTVINEIMTTISLKEISVFAPLGQALIGKKAGDEITVNLPFKNRVLCTVVKVYT